MKKENLKEEIAILINKCKKIYKQINSLGLINTQITIETHGIEEHLVQYNYETVFNEYMELEKKLMFFINKFLNEFYNLINNILSENVNTFFSVSNQEFSYYFDSILTTISTMLELEQRDELERYFNNKKLYDIFPNRNNVGLWWEVYMLRNRVLHHTSKRYTYDKELCQCYMPFNSRVNCAQIDGEGNIILKTTLLDIYKDENIINAIKKSIVSKSNLNPFDSIFSNTSAKGKSKKNPFMLSISNNIFFDYSTSGIRFINEIILFILNLNNFFYEGFVKKIKDIKQFKEMESIIIFNEEQIKYKIIEVFNEKVGA